MSPFQQAQDGDVVLGDRIDDQMGSVDVDADGRGELGALAREDGEAGDRREDAEQGI